MAWSTVTVSNYNASPPPDDGTSTDANEITWAKHKTKLGDPIKTALETVISQLDTFFASPLAEESICRLKTGTYTGDGATSQAITGVGFQPKYVKIWQKIISDGTAGRIYETTDTIIDDIAAGAAWFHTGAGGHTVESNTIISLDADGFTVDDNGADDPPNANGAAYNYLCLG